MNQEAYIVTEINFAKTYSPLTSAEIVAQEKSNMDEKRFKHCIGVSETSRKLAELNDYDPDKAALAGFIHDYAKQVPPERFIKVIKEQHFDQDLLNYNRAIWHGIVGAYFIEKELKITDPEILTAIRRHTTADVEMSTLDKIVFVAGFIGSPQMNFFNVHFKGNRISDGKGLNIEIPEGKAKMLKDKGYEDKDLVFGIRPEDIHSEEAFLETWPNQTVKSTVVVSELLGSTIQLYQKVDGTEFVAIVNARDYHTPGDKVEMGFDVNKAHFFDKDTTNAIR